MPQFTDESLMPFGQHKGKKLVDVPAKDLIWLYENEKSGKITEYIKENLEVLKVQAKRGY